MPSTVAPLDPAAATYLLAGVDLAWGEKNGDGVCLIEYRAATARKPASARILGHTHVRGDEALFAALAAASDLLPPATPDAPVYRLFAFDAPLVCINASGRRPVDGLVSAAFRARHAGCYPVNLRLAPRPLRIAARLTAGGFALTPALPTAAMPWVAAEVFPHPALVRWLGLDRILEYKRKSGRSREHSDAEFARLQHSLAGLCASHFPYLAWHPDSAALLAAAWRKPVEDQLDAWACVLIALWHIHHEGRRSEVFGDDATGFVLMPGGDADRQVCNSRLLG
jgi:predicted RNase H-like nuclease